MIKGQEKKIYSKKNTMAIKHEKKFLTLVIMKKMKSEVYWVAIFYIHVLTRFQKFENILLWHKCGKRHSHALLMGMKNGTTLMKSKSASSFKITNAFPFDPEIPLVGGKFFWQLYLNMITQLSVALFLQQTQNN